jgi:DNA ligase 1
MSKTFKPMLAEVAEDLEAIRFPVLASTKLDGVRCVITPDGPRARSLKTFKNRQLMNWLSHPSLVGLDGELVLGDATAPGVIQRTTGATNSFEGDIWDMQFHVFDHINFTDTIGFASRFENARRAIERYSTEMGGAGMLKLHPHVLIRDLSELMDFEAKSVDAGYEGIMIRDPAGYYKFGRSTEKEGLLLKIKRFADDEGTVIAYEEMYHNNNPAEKNELGRTKRSTRQEGMTPAGVLGAVILSSPKWPGVEIRVGGGFTADQRAQLWAERETLAGRICTFKHQPSGAKDAPRFPVFKNWRAESDMDVAA